jgi:ketosteroid isomerase-like protein
MTQRPAFPADEAKVTREIVGRCTSAWEARDLDATLACMDDDIVYELNVDPRVAPFAGTVGGKAAVREKLQLILDTFLFDAYIVETMKVAGPVARCSIQIYYRHRASNVPIDVRFRLVFTQTDGLISRLEEYHDAAYVEAFLRLFGQPPPEAGDDHSR